MPSGREPFAGMSGPLSILQITMAGPEVKYIALSRLIEAMCEVDAPEVGRLAASWLSSQYSHAPVGAIGALFGLIVALGVNSEFITAADVLTLVLLTVQRAILISASDQDNEGADALLISHIAALLDPQRTGIASLARPKSTARAHLVLDSVGKFLPNLAGRPNVNLRMDLARLVKNWEASAPVPLPPDLAGVLQTLRGDARARVRYYASWYEPGQAW